MIYQNLRNAAKVVLKGEFIAMQAYLKKQVITQISTLPLHLMELDNEKQTRSKVNREKEIIKMWAEVNKIETKKKKRSMKLRAGSLKREIKWTKF